MPVLSDDNTGQSILKVILDFLNEGNILLENYLSLSVDNAPEMVWKNNKTFHLCGMSMLSTQFGCLKGSSMLSHGYW